MAAGLAATALDRPGDLGLAAGAAARFARSRAADVGLVGLDPRDSGARCGRTIALRILCSQVQAVW